MKINIKMCEAQSVSAKKVSDRHIPQIVKYLKNIKSTITDMKPFSDFFLNIRTIMAITETKLILQIHVTQCYV